MRTIAIVALLMVSPLQSFAQGTGGVFGPVVNEGHRAGEYRSTWDESDVWQQRFHYQSAIDDDFMWRLVGQVRKPKGSSSDFDFLQAELFWQLPDIDNVWQHGVRFDLRYRDDNRPQSIGLNWMHQVDLGNKWSARLIALTSRDFGSNRRSGLGLQARGSVTRSMGSGNAMSILWFSDYGRSNDTASGSDQFQQIGPTFQFKVGKGWQVLFGALAGLTDATPNHEYRLWLTRSTVQ